MKFIQNIWAALLILSIGLVSCQPKEQPVREVECTFSINMPVGIEKGTYSDVVITLKSNQDGGVMELKPTQFPFKQTLLVGTYEMQTKATLSYRSEKLGVVRVPISVKENISVSSEKSTFAITPTYTEKTNAGLVIEELFLSPTVNPETGKNYTYGEQYIKITNNSDVTLYADRLLIMQSEDRTNGKREYKEKDILSKFFLVDYIAMIPGNGTDHPIEPGASIIIANDAIDHSKVFPGAVNLSKADFEMFDKSTNPRFQDVDNKDVPNLLTLFSYSLTVTSFHQRGCKAVALGRIPADITPEAYIKDYKYDQPYIFKFRDIVKEMPVNCYKVPYSWLIDVVNLAIYDAVEWLFVPSVYDAGYTGWYDTFNGKEGKGTAVIRKVAREDNGRKYLQDTNNSTNDFLRRVEASLKKAN